MSESAFYKIEDFLNVLSDLVFLSAIVENSSNGHCAMESYFHCHNIVPTKDTIAIVQNVIAEYSKTDSYFLEFTSDFNDDGNFFKYRSVGQEIFAILDDIFLTKTICLSNDIMTQSFGSKIPSDAGFIHHYDGHFRAIITHRLIKSVHGDDCGFNKHLIESYIKTYNERIENELVVPNAGDSYAKFCTSISPSPRILSSYSIFPIRGQDPEVKYKLFDMDVLRGLQMYKYSGTKFSFIDTDVFSNFPKSDDSRADTNTPRNAESEEDAGGRKMGFHSTKLQRATNTILSMCFTISPTETRALKDRLLEILRNRENNSFRRHTLISDTIRSEVGRISGKQHASVTAYQFMYEQRDEISQSKGLYVLSHSPISEPSDTCKQVWYSYIRKVNSGVFNPLHFFRVPNIRTNLFVDQLTKVCARCSTFKARVRFSTEPVGDDNLEKLAKKVLTSDGPKFSIMIEPSRSGLKNDVVVSKDTIEIEYSGSIKGKGKEKRKKKEIYSLNPNKIKPVFSQSYSDAVIYGQPDNQQSKTIHDIKRLARKNTDVSILKVAIPVSGDPAAGREYSQEVASEDDRILGGKPERSKRSKEIEYLQRINRSKSLLRKFQEATSSDDFRPAEKLYLDGIIDFEEFSTRVKRCHDSRKRELIESISAAKAKSPYIALHDPRPTTYIRCSHLLNLISPNVSTSDGQLMISKVSVSEEYESTRRNLDVLEIDSEDANIVCHRAVVKSLEQCSLESLRESSLVYNPSRLTKSDFLEMFIEHYREINGKESIGGDSLIWSRLLKHMFGGREQALSVKMGMFSELEKKISGKESPAVIPCMKIFVEMLRSGIPVSRMFLNLDLSVGKTPSSFLNAKLAVKTSRRRRCRSINEQREVADKIYELYKRNHIMGERIGADDMVVQRSGLRMILSDMKDIDYRDAVAIKNKFHKKNGFLSLVNIPAPDIFSRLKVIEDREGMFPDPDEYIIICMPNGDRLKPSEFNVENEPNISLCLNRLTNTSLDSYYDSFLTAIQAVNTEALVRRQSSSSSRRLHDLVHKSLMLLLGTENIQSGRIIDDHSIDINFCGIAVEVCSSFNSKESVCARYADKGKPIILINKYNSLPSKVAMIMCEEIFMSSIEEDRSRKSAFLGKMGKESMESSIKSLRTNRADNYDSHQLTTKRSFDSISNEKSMRMLGDVVNSRLVAKTSETSDNTGPFRLSEEEMKEHIVERSLQISSLLSSSHAPTLDTGHFLRLDKSPTEAADLSYDALSRRDQYMRDQVKEMDNMCKQNNIDGKRITNDGRRVNFLPNNRNDFSVVPMDYDSTSSYMTRNSLFIRNTDSMLEKEKERNDLPMILVHSYLWRHFSSSVQPAMIALAKTSTSGSIDLDLVDSIACIVMRILPKKHPERMSKSSAVLILRAVIEVHISVSSYDPHLLQCLEDDDYAMQVLNDECLATSLEVLSRLQSESSAMFKERVKALHNHGCQISLDNSIPCHDVGILTSEIKRYIPECKFCCSINEQIKDISVNYRDISRRIILMTRSSEEKTAIDIKKEIYKLQKIIYLENRIKDGRLKCISGETSIRVKGCSCDFEQMIAALRSGDQPDICMHCSSVNSNISSKKMRAIQIIRDATEHINSSHNDLKHMVTDSTSEMVDESEIINSICDSVISSGFRMDLNPGSYPVTNRFTESQNKKVEREPSTEVLNCASETAQIVEESTKSFTDLTALGWMLKKFLPDSDKERIISEVEISYEIFRYGYQWAVSSCMKDGSGKTLLSKEDRETMNDLMFKARKIRANGGRLMSSFSSSGKKMESKKASMRADSKNSSALSTTASRPKAVVRSQREIDDYTMGIRRAIEQAIILNYTGDRRLDFDHQTHEVEESSTRSKEGHVFFNEHIDMDIHALLTNIKDDNLRKTITSYLMSDRNFHEVSYKRKMSQSLSSIRNGMDQCIFTDSRYNVQAHVKRFGSPNSKDSGSYLINYMDEDGRSLHMETWGYHDIIGYSTAALRYVLLLINNVSCLSTGKNDDPNTDLALSISKLYSTLVCTNDWGISKVLKKYRYYVQAFISRSPSLAKSFSSMIDEIMDESGSIKKEYRNKHSMNLLLTWLVKADHISGSPVFALPDKDLGYETCLINLCSANTSGSKRHLKQVMKETFDESELSREHYSEYADIFEKSIKICEKASDIVSNHVPKKDSDKTSDDADLVDKLEASLRDDIESFYLQYDYFCQCTSNRFTFTMLSIASIFKNICQLGEKVKDDFFNVPTIKELCSVRSSFNQMSLATSMASSNILALCDLHGTFTTSNLTVRVVLSHVTRDNTFKMFDKDQLGGDREISIMGAQMRVLQATSEYTARSYGKETGIDMLDDQGKLIKVCRAYSEAQLEKSRLYFSSDQTRWGPNFNTCTFAYVAYILSNYSTQMFMPCLANVCCEFKIFETSYSPEDIGKQSTHRTSVPGFLGRFHMGQGIFHYNSSLYHSLVAKTQSDILSVTISSVNPGSHLTTTSFVTSDDASSIYTISSDTGLFKQIVSEVNSDQGLDKKVLYDASKRDRVARLIENSFRSSIMPSIRSLFSYKKTVSDDSDESSTSRADRISNSLMVTDQAVLSDRDILDIISKAFKSSKKCSSKSLLSSILMDCTNQLTRHYGIKSSEYKNIISEGTLEFNSFYIFPDGLGDLSTKFINSSLDGRTTGDLVLDISRGFSLYGNMLSSGVSLSSSYMVTLMSLKSTYDKWRMKANERSYPSQSFVDRGLLEYKVLDQSLRVNNSSVLKKETLRSMAVKLASSDNSGPQVAEIRGEIYNTISGQSMRSDVLKCHFIPSMKSRSYKSSYQVKGTTFFYDKRTVSHNMCSSGMPFGNHFMSQSQVKTYHPSVKTKKYGSEGCRGFIAHVYHTEQNKVNVSKDSIIAGAFQSTVDVDYASSATEFCVYLCRLRAKEEIIVPDFTADSEDYVDVCLAVDRFFQEEVVNRGSCMYFKFIEGKESIRYYERPNIDISSSYLGGITIKKINSNLGGKKVVVLGSTSESPYVSKEDITKFLAGFNDESDIDLSSGELIEDLLDLRTDRFPAKEKVVVFCDGNIRIAKESAVKRLLNQNEFSISGGTIQDRIEESSSRIAMNDSEIRSMVIKRGEASELSPQEIHITENLDDRKVFELMLQDLFKIGFANKSERFKLWLSYRPPGIGKDEDYWLRCLDLHLESFGAKDRLEKGNRQTKLNAMGFYRLFQSFDESKDWSSLIKSHLVEKKEDDSYMMSLLDQYGYDSDSDEDSSGESMNQTDVSAEEELDSAGSSGDEYDDDHLTHTDESDDDEEGDLTYSDMDQGQKSQVIQDALKIINGDDPSDDYDEFYDVREIVDRIVDIMRQDNFDSSGLEPTDQTLIDMIDREYANLDISSSSDSSSDDEEEDIEIQPMYVYESSLVPNFSGYGNVIYQIKAMEEMINAGRVIMVIPKEFHLNRTERLKKYHNRLPKGQDVLNLVKEAIIDSFDNMLTGTTYDGYSTDTLNEIMMEFMINQYAIHMMKMNEENGIMNMYVLETELARHAFRSFLNKVGTSVDSSPMEIGPALAPSLSRFCMRDIGKMEFELMYDEEFETSSGNHLLIKGPSSDLVAMVMMGMIPEAHLLVEDKSNFFGDSGEFIKVVKMLYYSCCDSKSTSFVYEMHSKMSCYITTHIFDAVDKTVNVVNIMSENRMLGIPEDSILGCISSGDSKAVF